MQLGYIGIAWHHSHQPISQKDSIDNNKDIGLTGKGGMKMSIALSDSRKVTFRFPLNVFLLPLQLRVKFAASYGSLLQRCPSIISNTLFSFLD